MAACSSGVNKNPFRARASPLCNRLSHTVVGAASNSGIETGNDQKKNIGSRVQAKADQAPPINSFGRWRTLASRQPVSSVRFCPAQLSLTLNRAEITAWL